MITYYVECLTSVEINFHESVLLKWLFIDLEINIDRLKLHHGLANSSLGNSHPSH